MDVSSFLAVSRVAARQVAAVAVRFQNRVTNEGKAGRTPEAAALTMVDLAAQDIFLELLWDRAPEIAVDAEEDTPLAHRFSDVGDRLVVLDPIDGTASYLSGSRDWAVMAGLILEGRFEAALIHYPGHGLTVEATRERGAWIREGDSVRSVQLSHRPPERVLVGPRYPAPARDALTDRGVTVETCRCSAIEGAAPVLGRADGALTHHPVDRRHATALFVSLAAGATVRFDGVQWTGEDPATHDGGGPTAVARRAEDADAWVALTRAAAS